MVDYNSIYDIDELNDDELDTYITIQEDRLSEGLRYYLNQLIEALIRAKRFDRAEALLVEHDKQDEAYWQGLIAHGRGDVDEAVLLLLPIFFGSGWKHDALLNCAWFKRTISHPALLYIVDSRFTDNEVVERYLLEYQPYTTADYPGNWLSDLSSLYEERADLIASLEGRRYTGHKVIYGDVAVEGNHYFPNNVLILGNLTVSGCLITGDQLHVAGDITVGALIFNELLSAQHVRASQFIYAFSKNGATAVYEEWPIIVAHATETPMLLLERDEVHLHGELIAEVLLIANREPENLALAKKVLKPECLLVHSDNLLDFHQIDHMTRSGESIFLNNSDTWHAYPSAVLSSVYGDDLTAYHCVDGYLPTDILTHRDTLVELYIKGHHPTRLPDYIYQLNKLQTLTIIDSGLLETPPALGQLTQLNELVVGRAEPLKNQYDFKQFNALLALCTQQAFAPEVRQRLYRLIEKRPISDNELAAFPDAELLFLYQHGMKDVMPRLLQRWGSVEVTLTADSTISVLGRTKLKSKDFAEQVSASGAQLLVNEITEDTTHIVVAGALNVKAIASVAAYDTQRALVMLTEQQCLDSLGYSTDAPVDTSQFNNLVSDPAYFKYKVATVVGRFKHTNRDEVMNNLKALGVKIQPDAYRYDLAIVGSGNTLSVNNARDKSAVVWDEGRFLATLSTLPKNHLGQQFLDDPTLPGVELDRNDSVIKLAGRPCEWLRKKVIMGEQLAYKVGVEDLGALFANAGISTLRGLVVEGGQAGASEVTEPLLAYAQVAPHISSFALSGELEVNVSECLDTFPNLTVLWLDEQVNATLEPVRHSHLQQLVIRNDVSQDLAMCSFPNLTFLDIGGDNIGEVLAGSVAQQQFSQLAHLGLYGPDDAVSIINELSLPLLRSLAITFNASGYITDEVIEALIASPLAATLQTLDLSYLTLENPQRINSDTFPALQRLGMHGGYLDGQTCPYPRYLSRMRFANGIHVDMRRANLRTRNAKPLMNALAKANALSLNADYNRIFSPEAQHSIRELTIPVSLWHQGE